jgi:hypothetical protein
MNIAGPLGLTRPGHGLERGDHGRAASLRTASIAMTQANLLLPTTGRSSDSVVTMDLMPPAWLSGEELFYGEMRPRTGSAATLWLVTSSRALPGRGQIGRFRPSCDHHRHLTPPGRIDSDLRGRQGEAVGRHREPTSACKFLSECELTFNGFPSSSALGIAGARPVD